MHSVINVCILLEISTNCVSNSKQLKVIQKCATWEKHNNTVLLLRGENTINRELGNNFMLIQVFLATAVTKSMTTVQPPGWRFDPILFASLATLSA